jgi:predicted extracellular nuclease
VVLGDFNAYEFTDGYVDVMGQLTGTPDPEGALLPATEELEPPFTNHTFLLPAEERYSYVYRCSAQALDHVLTNRPMGRWVQEVAYARGNADSPREWSEVANSALRCSDHDGVVLFLGPPRWRPCPTCRRLETGSLERLNVRTSKRLLDVPIGPG